MSRQLFDGFPFTLFKTCVRWSLQKLTVFCLLFQVALNKLAVKTLMLDWKFAHPYSVTKDVHKFTNLRLAILTDQQYTFFFFFSTTVEFSFTFSVTLNFRTV